MRIVIWFPSSLHILHLFPQFLHLNILIVSKVPNIIHTSTFLTALTTAMITLQSGEIQFIVINLFLAVTAVKDNITHASFLDEEWPWQTWWTINVKSFDEVATSLFPILELDRVSVEIKQVEEVNKPKKIKSPV